MDSDTLERLRSALQRRRGIPVKVIPRSEWVSALRRRGEPTSLPGPLSPYASGLVDVPVVAVAASTYPAVSSPGYHHVRTDPADAPNVFNTDSYDAIEDLSREKDYPEICRIAGLTSRSVTRHSLRQHVFLLGPKKRHDHHSPEVPADIRKARKKCGPRSNSSSYTRLTRDVGVHE